MPCLWSAESAHYDGKQLQLYANVVGNSAAFCRGVRQPRDPHGCLGSDLRRIRNIACLGLVPNGRSLAVCSLPNMILTPSQNQLHFRHALEILSSARIKVTTEEKVLEAAIGW